MFVGEKVTLRGVTRDDLPSGHTELGITIGAKDCWGRGYGREAIQLLLDYAFRLANLRRVWLRTHAANERAIRAYQAVGFVQEGRACGSISGWPAGTSTWWSWASFGPSSPRATASVRRGGEPTYAILFVWGKSQVF